MLKRTSILVVLLSVLLWSLAAADTSTLVGTWVATREDGATTTWQFNADGSITATFDGMEGFKGTWKLNTETSPKQLDIISEGDKVETIVEFADNDTMRLEIGTANPGEPRPTKFSDMAATFKRK